MLTLLLFGCLLVCAATVAIPAQAAPERWETLRTIDDALKLSQNALFFVERKAGKLRLGDPESHFNRCTDNTNLTFDISNNKVLANVGVQGSLKFLSVYRDTYRSNCGGLPVHEGGWPGVWAAKDNSTYGPYSYHCRIDGTTFDLAKVDWDFRTGLLDNIFPITELHDPQGRFVVRLLTFAPLSPDGAQRVRGCVYGLQIENLSDAPLRGAVIRPGLPYPGRGLPPNWASFDPYDFEIASGDEAAWKPEVAFDLKKGQTQWVSTVLYPSGDPAPQEIQQRGTLAWLQDTARYYRKLLGRLQTPEHPFLSAFYEREVLQALQSIGMSESGKIAGSNWGSFPATRQIWMKDCFYSCLPFVVLDPLLAQKIILWFDEFGVRQKGVAVPGGISHAISLSVAAPLLASLYYDHTGDRTFFRKHSELRQRWSQLLDALVETRQDREVYLFPTRFISDGPVEGDYHTGSNIVVWRTLTGFSRLLNEVFGAPEEAKKYALIADKVRAALLSKTVVTGAFGPQFIETAFRDGRNPPLLSDGEESDTTLASFYGLLASDAPLYLNSMRFAASPHNIGYNPTLHALKWFGVPSTAPGYNKAIAAGVDAPALFGEHGGYTEFRRQTDADGSVWWWSYGGDGDPPYGAVVRAHWGIGKSGWAAGVHSVLFPSRFLGLSYDAPKRTLRLAPASAIGPFEWNDCPLGGHRFDLRYAPAPEGATLQVGNANRHPILLDILLPVPVSASTLLWNGSKLPQSKIEHRHYLGQDVIALKGRVEAGSQVLVQITRIRTE